MIKQLREAFDSLHEYYNIRSNVNYNTLSTICLDEDRPTEKCLIDIISRKRVYVGSLKCFHEEYLLPSFMGTYLSVYSMLRIGTLLRLGELLHMTVYSPEGNTCRKYKMI